MFKTFFQTRYIIEGKYGKNRVREKSLGSATITNATLPRHQEEEETDKPKQAQIKQTYEKHQD